MDCEQVDENEPQDTTDDEEGRESLATATLEEIVQRAQSAEPATQLAAVQVGHSQSSPGYLKLTLDCSGRQKTAVK